MSVVQEFLRVLEHHRQEFPSLALPEVRDERIYWDEPEVRLTLWVVDSKLIPSLIELRDGTISEQVEAMIFYLYRFNRGYRVPVQE